ncbi:MAG: hypothetical protein IPM59_15415 [Chloracidobacterium sp.]|nr:hypothetical protein [Chloracidobacterium sp.]
MRIEHRYLPWEPDLEIKSPTRGRKRRRLRIPSEVKQIASSTVRIHKQHRDAKVGVNARRAYFREYYAKNRDAKLKAAKLRQQGARKR